MLVVSVVDIEEHLHNHLTKFQLGMLRIMAACDGEHHCLVGMEGIEASSSEFSLSQICICYTL